MYNKKEMALPPRAVQNVYFETPPKEMEKNLPIYVQSRAPLADAVMYL
jgi:hypothetical protein